MYGFPVVLWTPCPIDFERDAGLTYRAAAHFLEMVRGADWDLHVAQELS